MIGTLFQRLAEARSDDAEDADKSGRFTGSMLDWSIYYGHDGGRSEAASEMAEIQAKAELLEEADHYRR